MPITAVIQYVSPNTHELDSSPYFLNLDLVTWLYH